MTDDRTLEGRGVVAGLGLALIAATAAFGALLGATLPDRTGLEEITVLAVSIPVSPLWLGLYGAVTVGTFLATLLLVVRTIARFDEAR